MVLRLTSKSEVRVGKAIWVLVNGSTLELFILPTFFALLAFLSVFAYGLNFFSLKLAKTGAGLSLFLSPGIDLPPYDITKQNIFLHYLFIIK